MEEHTGLVTLYDPETMKSRGKEFERKKNEWMKEYMDRTGRRWLNYYPREPITHHYYDALENGDKFTAETDRTQFRICNEDDLTEEDITKLNEMESEWMHDAKNKVSEKCQDNPDDEACKKVPPAFQIDNDKFYIGRMNDTTYCRNKISQDGTNITIEIINICAHGPHAFRIFNFFIR
eukprot:833011_1